MRQRKREMVDGLMAVNLLPGHLIVLGGGYAGRELAQAFWRFGSRVTLICSPASG